MAVMILLVLGGLMAAASPMIINEVKMNMVNRDTIEAQYAAEAGAKVGIAAIYAEKEDWEWLDLSKGHQPYALIPGVSNKKYTVAISPTPEQGKKPEPGKEYTITAIGEVNGIKKTVTVKVTAGGSSKILKYTAFAAGSMMLNGGTINGDISTNGSTTIWGTKVNGTSESSEIAGNRSNISGTTSCNNDTAKCDLEFSSTSTLDVSAYMKTAPAMPTFTMTGTPLPQKNNSALTGAYDYNSNPNSGKYYYDGNFSNWGYTYSVASTQSVFIYINGSCQWGRPITGGGNITIYATGNIEIYKNITGGNVKIYSGGSITTNGASISGSSILLQSAGEMKLNSGTQLTAASGGTINLYSGGNFELNSAKATADTVTIMSSGSYCHLNNNSAINASSTSAITKIYSTGATEVNGATIGGIGLIVSGGPSVIKLNANSSMAKTAVISQGDIEVNGATTGGLYSNGTITVNSGSTVTYDPAIIQSTVTETISTTEFSIDSWGTP
jgi:hypothetical protein